MRKKLTFLKIHQISLSSHCESEKKRTKTEKADALKIHWKHRQWRSVKYFDSYEFIELNENNDRLHHRFTSALWRCSIAFHKHKWQLSTCLAISLKINSEWRFFSFFFLWVFSLLPCFSQVFAVKKDNWWMRNAKQTMEIKGQ